MNSKQTIKIWSRVLMEAGADKSVAEQKKIIHRLGEILKSKKKDYLLEKIVNNALTSIENQSKLEITLARSQSQEFTNELAKKISAKLGANAAAKISIDPSLIAGFCAKTSQYIFNASIKNNLEQLKKTYTN